MKLRFTTVVASAAILAALLHGVYVLYLSCTTTKTHPSNVHVRVIEQTYNNHLLVVHYEPGQMTLARGFTGCVHRADPTQRILFVLTGRESRDEFDELHLFHNSITSLNTTTGGTQGKLQQCLLRPLLCGNTSVLFGEEQDKDASCWLRYKIPRTLPGQRPVFSKAEKPLIAFFVATYVPRAVAIHETPLVSIFLPAFLWSLRDDMPNFRFRLILGVQVDALWDGHWGDFMELLQREVAGVELDVVRYSLNPHLRGTAFKYNMLARRAYDSGAIITCQFSDDAKILTKGWAPVFHQYITERDGFGTFGFRDTKNAGTMTLGCSGRKHHEINGWFWPAPSMTNWFADDFVQQVWGPRYSHRFENLTFDNTQKEGQRYDECLTPGRDLLDYEWYAARVRAAKWFEEREQDHEKAKYLRELAGSKPVTNPLERPVAC